MLEGISFLLLLGVAMPLKYFAGLPQAVRIVGMTHGILFISYVALVGAFVLRRQWSWARAGEAMLYAIVPGGTFALDGKLRREQAAVG